MNKVYGKIALIAGRSDGIGLAIAQEFVAEGAYLSITGRHKEVIDLVVKQIGKIVTTIT